MNNKEQNKLAFIVGQYKSGSTWLAHLLSLYPGIRGIKETHVFRYVKEEPSFTAATEILFTKTAWGAGGAREFPKYWLGNITRGTRTKLGLAKGTASLSNHDIPTTIQDLGFLNQRKLRKLLENASNKDQYCEIFFAYLVNKLKPEHYLLEKTPTNIFHVEDIKRVFPSSKIISIHRDGRDVVVSDKHHLSRSGRESQSFEDRVLKWKNAMETEIKKAKQFDIHQLSYEDLKAEPKIQTRALLDFLNLKYDENTINEMVTGSSFESMSGGRSAGAENTLKFHRKGIVGDWRNEFTEDEIKTFAEMAGETLVQLGYETSSSHKDWN